MDNILLQQVEETKTYQETSETELKKIDENKNTLDMLTDSIRNVSALSEKSNKILEAHFGPYPVRSCRHVMTSGQYVIHVGLNLQPLKVLCEQTMFEGGWTVIQQRFDGSVDFYRNWTEYRNGFGTLDGEFWLGLEYLHQMTRNRPHELMVEMKDFRGNYGYSKYGEFEIGSESEMYVLKKLGKYSGTGGDSMWENEGMMFTTFDRDNDKSNSLNCAEDHHGAWWFWSCTASNLNGKYPDEYGSMSWYNFVGKWDWRALSYSRMMIRDIIN
ncbi:ficolin-1-like [Anopheles ziemanni]|uniref:ficolin-1-like n=1 Tax=Anopheles coustani TaxID=139045 RepID=UPI00265B0603|nr:ficolin-1-like [Anopheles coustani]XP_058176995.1 ficolin-1-like [Anopheles ziemanni]